MCRAFRRSSSCGDSLAVEHQGEAMPQGLRRKNLSVRLAGHLALQAWDDVLFEDLDQPGIDGLMDHEEGLTVHGIDPVVGLARRHSRCRAT